MKKIIISFLLLLFCTAQVAAQSDSQISQYIFFPAALNPAAVGKTGMIQAAAMNRMDFLTMANGVNTTNIGVNMPFTIGNSSHGAGIRFVYKTSGTLWSYQNAYLQYAFVRSTPIGNFRIGIDAGFIGAQFEGTRANPVPDPPDVGGGGDNEFHQPEPDIQQDISGMRANFNIGAVYMFERGYVGISVLNITRPTVILESDNGGFVLNDTIPRALHLMGVYRIRIPDTNMTVKPHTMIRTDFIVYEWSLGAVVEFDERFWGGLTTRMGTTAGGMTGFNAVGFKAGMNIAGGLSAGIVYDLPTTRLINTVGSVELMIAYNFEFVRNRHNRRHKSIRIL